MFLRKSEPKLSQKVSIENLPEIPFKQNISLRPEFNRFGYIHILLIFQQSNALLTCFIIRHIVVFASRTEGNEIYHPF